MHNTNEVYVIYCKKGTFLMSDKKIQSAISQYVIDPLSRYDMGHLSYLQP